MKKTELRFSRRQLLATFGIAALSSPFALFAQSDRPITLVLPVGPGSGVDTMIRSASVALNNAFKRTVVIENKPGAGGIIGTSALIKAQPDGYTLGVVSNNHVVYPSVYKSVPFDPIADITPISVIGATPFLLVVNPKKVAATNVKQFIAELKAKPGMYNYASSGNGTILHLATAMFVDQADVECRHIPYKGVGPMLTDLIGGQVDFAVSSLPSLLPHIQSGALRVLGVCGSARLPRLPEVPTIAEQGLPNYESQGWFAAIGPAKLPDADVQRAYAAFKEAYADPEVKKSMDAQGNTIFSMSPKESAAFFKSEMAKYAKVVANTGIEKV